MEIYNIIFSTFWHWLGTFLLLSLLVEMIIRVIGSFGTKPTYIKAEHVTVEADEENIKVKGKTQKSSEKTPEQ